MSNQKKPNKMVKICMVPECTNTSQTTPYKIFLRVPDKPKVKQQWRRIVFENSSKLLATRSFCCEDHFDMKQDMKNYARYKMQKNVRIIMKPGVVPHIFNCCEKQKINSGGNLSQSKSIEGMEKETNLTQLLDASTSRTVEVQEEIEENKDADGRMPMDPPFFKNTDSSESTSLQVTDVPDQQNFIKSEVDKNKLDRSDVLSEVILIKNVGCGSTEWQNSERNEKEEKIADQGTNEFLDGEIKQEFHQDFNSDPFGENEKSREQSEKGTVLKREHPVQVLDDQDTNEKKPRNISELYEKELQESIDVDMRMGPDCDPILKKFLYKPLYLLRPKRIPANIPLLNNTDKVEPTTAEEDRDSKEPEIIDDDDDTCFIPERTEKIIRRTDSMYACPLNCTFLTADRTLLIQHLISHKGNVKTQRKTALVCPLCSFETMDEGQFVDHVGSHEVPHYACKKCSFVTMKQHGLTMHLLAKHQITASCDKCRFKTNRLGSWNSHQRDCPRRIKLELSQIAKGDVFRCQFDPCPYTANNEQGLKTHEWIQHQVGSNNIEKYKCYVYYCHFETFRKDLLEDHINTHLVLHSQLQCKQCPFRTSDWKVLKDHVISHAADTGTTWYSKKND